MSIQRRALLLACLGMAALPAPGAAQSAATPAEEAVARLALLTRQQGKILQLVSAGLMNKQIAYELSIAETTVKAHVTAIMRKLGVQTRTQAVLFAQDLSFASMSPSMSPPV